MLTQTRATGSKDPARRRLLSACYSDSDELLRGYGADSAESWREHAGYQCLGCRQTWSESGPPSSRCQSRWDSTLGPPYLRGARCGTQNSAARLHNVPRAHLATCQAQAVPIYSPGTQGRSNTGSKCENKAINTYFYSFERITTYYRPPPKTGLQPWAVDLFSGGGL